MVLINGTGENCIGISDRGLQYGDGLFETLLVVDGQLILLQEHLQRLKTGCARLLIPCPDLDLLATEAKQLAKTCKNKAVLKIIITRGVGGRGYRQPEVIQPTRILSLHPYPDYPAQFKQEGINARFCRTCLGINPQLAGIKHLNRLEQVLARAEWNDPEIQEGLMIDSLGRVIEGTMSNLFLIKNSILYTSPVTSSGVMGIIRDRIILLAARNDFPLRQQYFNQTRLLNADEVFVTNSIIGIWPVRHLEKKSFPVGQYTQQFMTWLDASI